MRKKNRWHKLNIILWALLLVPPLGFYLLWSAPWTRKSKVSLTVATFALFGVLAGVVWGTGLYRDFVEPAVPTSGFCVDRDNQGHYLINRVLPFEKQVFGEVVAKKRQYQKEMSTSFSQTGARTVDDPETRAFDTVAEQHGLDTTDVMAIFMKVSSKMVPGI